MYFLLHCIYKIDRYEYSLESWLISWQLAVISTSSCAGRECFSNAWLWNSLFKHYRPTHTLYYAPFTCWMKTKQWLFKMIFFCCCCWVKYVTCICLSSLLYTLSCIYCNIYRLKHICGMTCVSKTLHPAPMLSTVKCCHMKNEGGYDGFCRRDRWRHHWRWCKSDFSGFTYSPVSKRWAMDAPFLSRGGSQPVYMELQLMCQEKATISRIF